MKYRWKASAVARYGSGRASSRAFACLYCFFCSSDPVSASIHFAVMSVLLVGLVRVVRVQLFDALGEGVPGRPELRQLVRALRIEGVHLAGRALLARHLLDIDESALLDAHQQGVDGALGGVGEAVLAQACGDVVSV